MEEWAVVSFYGISKLEEQNSVTFLYTIHHSVVLRRYPDKELPNAQIQQ
jgi:hypothetical protein